MSDLYGSLSPDLTAFIQAQHLFFVATAAADGRVNMSPKGHDSLKVTGPNALIWQNLTGSGNETAAHLRDTNRMTLMWCSFEGSPQIVRVYGTAETIHAHHPAWAECAALIPATVGTRQFFRVEIDLVQTSCGYAVPLMDYQGDREILRKWAKNRGEGGIREYWEEKNQVGLDGQPTGIFGD
jgi:hypothetical protein